MLINLISTALFVLALAQGAVSTPSYHHPPKHICKGHEVGPCPSGQLCCATDAGNV
ncbi:hypothetical protein C8R44DRAFT_889426 [Mycena epipterygia]|nr:hypothetical protein C8R44DRAFT_889426 [Mycena epipterygia]